MAAFHWRDDIFFERLANGDVRVYKRAFAGGPILFEMTVPTREWCSIVAACSATPGLPDTFRIAEKLHTGR